MKVALLIHVHTNPTQVARLVSKLKHPDVDIYINVDKKVDIREFESEVRDVIYIQNRVEVYWGRFSQVQQILNSFQEIIDSQTSYSHILFISGADYPIKPIDSIVSLLAGKEDKSLIDFHTLGNDNWSNLMRRRYEYWFFLPENDIRNKPIVKKVLQKIGFKRKYPFKEVYYGSCWFCLASNAVKYLLEYAKNNEKVIDFFRYTGCSDELFIQSVLLNSSLDRNCFINETYRYYDWSDQGKSPKVLTIEDYSEVEKSDSWFARKLDLNVDSRLFDLLDDLIK